MGNAGLDKIRYMLSKKAKLIPVWTLDTKGRKDILKLQGEAPTHKRLLDESGIDINNADYPNGGTNFYRSDDVSATAYFYLDQPQSNLPALPSVELRMKDMKQKVFDKVGNSAK